MTYGQARPRQKAPRSSPASPERIETGIRVGSTETASTASAQTNTRK